jgi:hypothetical protein
MIAAAMSICVRLVTAVWREWVGVSAGGSIAVRASRAGTAREDGLRWSLGGSFGGCATVRVL